MDPIITLDYGSGGKKTAALIDDLILPLLGNGALNDLPDAAAVPGAESLVFSTDSFVVSPCFFPGGDIGKLAVCGTVNDVCVSGGEPKYLSLGLILEEGFPTADLERILRSIRDTANRVGVQVVTGDTKVVERGRGDGIYINTSGIGYLRTPGLSERNLCPGDKVLLSGTAGDHGAAVMLARNANLVEGELKSDCAPLHELCAALGTLGERLRVMRDPTRGGVATTLCEFAEGANVCIELDEEAIPVAPGVESACDILGLDPLYCACEGKLLAFVAPEAEEDALRLLRTFPEGRNAAVIGEVTAAHPGRVLLRTAVGGTRVMTRLTGAQLPRIC